MLLAGFAYYILSQVLVAHHGKQSTLALALGRDLKGKLSLLMYSLAIPLAFVDPRLAWALYIAVAVIWMIPDRRIETVLEEQKS
jgi:hypothetical protein